MDLVLRGGTVVQPDCGTIETADVWLRDGAVAAIGSEPQAADWQAIDVSGLIVCPGLIDIHVHLREPGQEHKETIRTGTRSAIAGGFTTVCCMPNTSPAIDRADRVGDLASRIESDALCRVEVIAAITLDNAGLEFADVPQLVGAGSIAVTDDAFPLQTTEMMTGALERCSRSGLPFIAHCEDRRYARDGVMNLGEVSASLGVPGQSDRSESESLAAWMEAAGTLALPGQLHIAHVSSAGLLVAADVFGRVAPRGLLLTLETAPHYFALTDEAVREFGADAKMNPPLRADKDRRAVRGALVSGAIQAIATDHAPHSPAEKSQGLIDAPFGIVGLETALGVTLTELVHSGEMPLPDCLARMTCGPADVLGLRDAGGAALGRLAVGGPADITIIDPKARWTVDPGSFQSKGRNTPFAGRELVGRAWGTIVGGQPRMLEYELV